RGTDMASITMPQTTTTGEGIDFRVGQSLTDVLLERIQADPEATLMLRPAGDGAWAEVSGQRFLDEVASVAKGLLAAGLESGGRVALFGSTAYEWTLCDYAIWFAGGVTVPFYDSSSADQLAWMITDADVSYALVQSDDHALR